MRYQIRECENAYSGKPFFHVYKWEDERWSYQMGDADIALCRAYIERQRNPKPETVIEEVTI